MLHSLRTCWRCLRSGQTPLFMFWSSQNPVLLSYNKNKAPGWFLPTFSPPWVLDSVRLNPPMWYFPNSCWEQDVFERPTSKSWFSPDFQESWAEQPLAPDWFALPGVLTVLYLCWPRAKSVFIIYWYKCLAEEEMWCLRPICIRLSRSLHLIRAGEGNKGQPGWLWWTDLSWEVI